MASHGGHRTGSGRKPRSQKFATAIRRAEKKIADRLPGLADKLIALAEEGDREALVYLLNRILGKPTVRVESEAEVRFTGDARDKLRARIAALAGRGPADGGPG